MKPKVLLILNALSLFITLFVNYTAGTGAVGSRSIGEVSDQYPTLITPASYAFSIWGLIYLLLIAFVGFQWVSWYKHRKDEWIQATGSWFLLANTANSLWVLAWVHEMLGISVLLMIFLLFCLFRLVVRLKLENWDAPLRTVAFVWWPICIYTGWIILATVVNIAVHMKSLQLLSNLLSEEFWAVVVLLLAGAIYLYLIWSRNMREAALVGVWGLIAIGYNQWEDHQEVAFTALLLAATLFMYTAYHGLKRKNTSPLAKWERGEW